MKKYILALICLLTLNQNVLSESFTTENNKIIESEKEVIKEKEISFEQKIKEINSKITNDSKNYQLYYDRGIIYYNKSAKDSTLSSNNNESFKKIKLAAEDFEKSIKYNPNHSESYIYLSLSLLKINNVLNNMLLEFDKNFNKNNYMEKLANKRSLSKFGRANLEKMGREYNNILRNIKGLEQTVLLTKRYSFENIKKAEELNSENPYVYNAYTYYYINELDLKKAKENIEKALALEPRNHEFYNTQGILNLTEKNYKSAEENFKTALDLLPNNFEYTKNLLNIYLQNKDKDKFFSLINKNLELEPNNESLKFLYQSGLKILPDNESRETTLNGFINNTSNKNNYNGLISQSYLLISNYEKNLNKSINYLQISLNNDPNNVKAKINISKKYLDLANNEKNLKNKISILEDFSKKNLSIDLISLELAKLYKLNKNYDKSIDKYTLLIKNGQKKAEYYYELALLYALKKDKSNSTSNLKKSISLNKKYKKISRKEKLLKYI